MVSVFPTLVLQMFRFVSDGYRIPLVRGRVEQKNKPSNDRARATLRGTPLGTEILVRLPPAISCADETPLGERVGKENVMSARIGAAY